MKKLNLGIIKTLILTCLSLLILCTLDAQQVGINTTTPDQALDVNGKLKVGDDATTPSAGTMRYNSTSNEFEGYNGTAWVSLSASSGGSGGGIPNVTETEKNAMSGAANGTLVYQTDGYKGIYAKESDGWRSQSGDTPIHFIDLGTISGSWSGTPVTLTAEHHTIYIHGSWDTFEETPEPISLPLSCQCKGRKYRIIVQNEGSYTLPADFNVDEDDHTYLNEYGYLAVLSSGTYRPIDAGLGVSYSELPADRAIIIQYDGLKWVQIQDDKLNPIDLQEN